MGHKWLRDMLTCLGGNSGRANMVRVWFRAVCNLKCREWLAFQYGTQKKNCHQVAHLTVGSHRGLFSCWARGNDALANCELQSLRDFGFNLARSFRRTSRQRSTASALSRQKDLPPENVASVCVLIWSRQPWDSSDRFANWNQSLGQTQEVTPQTREVAPQPFFYILPLKTRFWTLIKPLLCRMECQNRCQREWQKHICQIECQIECQNMCWIA